MWGKAANHTLLSLGIGLLVLVGCGRQSESSATKDSGMTQPSAFIGFGGYASCGNHDPRRAAIASNFLASIKQLREQTGVEPQYFMICHELGSDLLYVTSFEPNTVRRAPIEQAYDLIRDVHQGKLDTYIAGHSYGAWLALTMAKQLGDEELPIKVLATVDPISRKDCFFNRPGGCFGFPGDITPAMRSDIRDHTGHWSNFYQTKTLYLHSGPAAEASDNLKAFVGHTHIDTDETVWKKIYGDLVGN